MVTKGDVQDKLAATVVIGSTQPKIALNRIIFPIQG